MPLPPLPRLAALPALAALICAPAALSAQPVFQCQIGKKLLQVDLEGDLASYSFGPQGAAELRFSQKVADLGYIPWNGIGVDMPEAVQFTNGDVTYEVWYSVRKLLEDNQPMLPPMAGVRVLQGDKVLADLTCSKPPRAPDLYAIYDAKLAAGQCYDWESQSWGTACQP